MGSNSLSKQPSRISVEDFASILTRVGFKEGKYAIATFNIFTICKLFDDRGSKRFISPASTTELYDFGITSQTRQPKHAHHDNHAQMLLEKIQEECNSRKTGWKYIVGWVTKPVS